jgi:endonuclease VIII
MPEGDAVHRAARRLQTLVGEPVEVETPNPQARAALDAGRLNGRRLVSVEAVGKNLVLRFEGGFVLRNHLRMSGRWRVGPRGHTARGRPWLVLRGAEQEAVLYGGRVLELHGRGLRNLGPDILAEPPDLDRMIANLRHTSGTREVGDALLDQRLVAGIGNAWRTEALWHAEVSPWRSVASVSDSELRSALEASARLMRRAVDGGREKRAIYRRAGRPCPRCGDAIRSRGQGDANRIAYWCPSCQR